MKAYLDLKKTGDKYKYGLTIYSDTGEVLNSSVKHVEKLENKFSNIIDMLSWFTQKLKVLTQNKVFDEDEPVYLFISSKSVYLWFESELAPEPYTIPFDELLLDMSFILNPLEIIQSENVTKRVLFRDSQEDKGVRVTDLFN